MEIEVRWDREENTEHGGGYDDGWVCDLHNKEASKCRRRQSVVVEPRKRGEGRKVQTASMSQVVSGSPPLRVLNLQGLI